MLPPPPPEPVAEPAPPPVTPPLLPPEPEAPRIGDGPVRVAVLVPLSGRFEALGRSLMDAAQMALFDIGEPRIVLIPHDTLGTEDGARAAMQAALDDDSHMVIGPVFAASIRAVAPQAQRYGIPVIGFSTDRDVAGNGVYILGFTPEQQIARIVEHAFAQGKRRFAALIPETPYGTKVLQAYRETITRMGGELVQIEMFGQDTTQYFDPVKRLSNYDARADAHKVELDELYDFGDDDLVDEMVTGLQYRETIGRLPFDAVLLPAGGGQIRSLAPLLPYYDIDPEDVLFLGTGLWDDPGLRLEPALIGARFAGPAPAAGAHFTERFNSIYDNTPPRVASLAYDAIALAATLLRMDPDQPFTKAAITNRRGFAGIDGVFKFGMDGVADRRLTIIEITEQGLAPVEEQRRDTGSSLLRSSSLNE